jgi:hypothetical protein
MDYLKLKNTLATCKTDKQALKAITDNGFKVVKDDSIELGSFSVWLDDTTRIYKTLRKEYILQKWERVQVKYSGIPTFFSTGL